MLTSRFLRVAVLVAAIPAWGQTTRPAAPARQLAPASRSAASAQPRLSDAQLESIIRTKFAKSKSANTFKVHVQGGVATIEGQTDVVQHKGAATHMAKSAGAVAVNNRVQISDSARQKAASNLETGRRRAQIKRGDARSQQTAKP
jgi:BON domain